MNRNIIALFFLLTLLSGCRSLPSLDKSHDFVFFQDTQFIPKEVEICTNSVSQSSLKFFDPFIIGGIVKDVSKSSSDAYKAYADKERNLVKREIILIINGYENSTNLPYIIDKIKEITTNPKLAR